MAGNFKFAMEGKDMVKFLTLTIENFVQDRLINKEERLRHKEQCAERLAAEDGGGNQGGLEVRYADQAVLANLDWGIEAMEEAINTSNLETKMARLDHAERMLQVCAMLDSKQKTAGVPNFYLSAWSHLNLAYLWKLKNNTHKCVFHILEMFIVDPFFSRVDFAPELWQALFLPHISSIVGWYTEERQRIVMDVMPDSIDLSMTSDFDQFFNESLIFSMRPDQAEKLHKLEKRYGESLDENTRLYAKYFKECVHYDTATSKKGMPMLPIAEPPMTPLREVSQSIPNYVKFGPILPKSAGFSPILSNGNEEGAISREHMDVSESKQLIEDSNKVTINKGNEEEEDFDFGHMNINTKSKSYGRVKDNIAESRHSPDKESPYSPSVFSPLDSPQTPSPNNTLPDTVSTNAREPKPILRLHSKRFLNTVVPTSLPGSPLLHNDINSYVAESDEELLDVHRNYRSSKMLGQRLSFNKNNKVSVIDSHLSENEEDINHSNISLPTSEKSNTPTRPPKDFVCSITSQLFNDPVTLETGQTYERKAIQEWLKRGNTTCPITRQTLSTAVLPKTNYVLKRLIASWKEQHPDVAQEFSYSETPLTSPSPLSSRRLSLESASPKVLGTVFTLSAKNNSNKTNYDSKKFMRMAISTSPTSVISQAAIESVINGLKPYTSCLRTSKNLKECETAVITIARMWKDSKADRSVHVYLAETDILNGFVDILSASDNIEVLRVAVYVITELIYYDESVRGMLNSIDSDFDCLLSLLKDGLSEACVLIHQLRPEFSLLYSHDIIPSLVQVISNKHEEPDEFTLMIEPKDAAIALLDQILSGGDEKSRSANALSVISANGLPSLVKCLDQNERVASILPILLSCMRANKNCRNLIAFRSELGPVLELFHSGSDDVKSICIEFLSELVHLNRRTLSNQVLKTIKDEGAFSTMHSFLVYLQMASTEQQPILASLLLQLDLLVEPWKMSIYREEAIETIIDALCRKDFPIAQASALNALASLPGRLTALGKPVMEARLLKVAGIDKLYDGLLNSNKIETMDAETMEEEEREASAWERRVAFVLCNHEQGSIFKALEECFKSSSLDVARSCLIISTWLIHMLNDLPETGMRNVARKCLLDKFINVLQYSRKLEEKALSFLAMKSFINDPEASKEIGSYAICICKCLRKLKKYSVEVTDTIKSVMNLPSVNAAEVWSCTEAVETDSSANGEVLSMVHFGGKLFSSHSDGHIKMWSTGKRELKVIQDVRAHAKATTCFSISSSGDKLYSGSPDKTIRVWKMESEELHCIHVHEMKEGVQALAAHNHTLCFSSQGTGVKVLNGSGASSYINFNRTVKCLAMTGKNLYCGCSGYSIQEVDLDKSTSSTFYSGTRKLLGKQNINALCVQDGLLYSGGSSVDGIAGKVFQLSTKATKGCLASGFDIHSMAVNRDYIFTGTKCGIIEVWLRHRLVRVASIKVHGGGNSKISSLAVDSDTEMLFAGTSEGKIQGWYLD